MNPSNSILQLETTLHTLRAIANDGHDLVKDHTALSDGGTVSNRFTAAVLKLEPIYLQLLDAAQIPNPAAPTPAAAEAAEVAKALGVPTDAVSDSRAAIAAFAAKGVPGAISAPAGARPVVHRKPNPLTGRLD